MRTVEEYFAAVRQVLEVVSDAQAERYDEQILTATRGNLRINVVASPRPSIDQILHEVEVFRGEAISRN